MLNKSKYTHIYMLCILTYQALARMNEDCSSLESSQALIPWKNILGGFHLILDITAPRPKLHLIVLL
jgi:hypothetical protein